MGIFDVFVAVIWGIVGRNHRVAAGKQYRTHDISGRIFEISG